MSEVATAFSSFAGDLMPQIIVVLGVVLGIFGAILLFKFGTRWFKRTAGR